MIERGVIDCLLELAVALEEVKVVRLSEDVATFEAADLEPPAPRADILFDTPLRPSLLPSSPDVAEDESAS